MTPERKLAYDRANHLTFSASVIAFYVPMAGLLGWVVGGIITGFLVGGPASCIVNRISMGGGAIPSLA